MTILSSPETSQTGIEVSAQRFQHDRLELTAFPDLIHDQSLQLGEKEGLAEEVRLEVFRNQDQAQGMLLVFNRLGEQGIRLWLNGDEGLKIETGEEGVLLIEEKDGVVQKKLHKWAEIVGAEDWEAGKNYALILEDAEGGKVLVIDFSKVEEVLKSPEQMQKMIGDLERDLGVDNLGLLLSDFFKENPQIEEQLIELFKNEGIDWEKTASNVAKIAIVGAFIAVATIALRRYIRGRRTSIRPSRLAKRRIAGEDAPAREPMIDRLERRVSSFRERAMKGGMSAGEFIRKKWAIFGIAALAATAGAAVFIIKEQGPEAAEQFAEEQAENPDKISVADHGPEETYGAGEKGRREFIERIDGGRRPFGGFSEDKEMLGRLGAGWFLSGTERMVGFLVERGFEDEAELAALVSEKTGIRVPLRSEVPLTEEQIALGKGVFDWETELNWEAAFSQIRNNEELLARLLEGFYEGGHINAQDLALYLYTIYGVKAPLKTPEEIEVARERYGELINYLEQHHPDFFSFEPKRQPSAREIRDILRDFDKEMVLS